MCSRSLIFESEKSETPIFKYFYRYYNSQPDIVDPKKNDQSYFNIFSNSFQKKMIIINTKRLVEIVTTGPPSPYINKEN